jgi:pimeloyl-ACP methyl ester carboxylesterase
MKYIKLFFIFSMFFVSLPVAYAETHITSNTTFENGTAWLKDGNPYILDNSVTIPFGTSLYVGPGVMIMASSTPDNPISIFASGDMTIAGTADEPVTITGLDSMTISRSNAEINHADIDLPDGIEMFYATTTIASSTIHGAHDPSSDSSNGSAKAISSWGSNLTIKDSSIRDNDYGIYSYYISPGPFLSMIRQTMYQAMFGQTALADVTDDPKQNHIFISGSDITGNGVYGIFNATSNVIHAENNWWGSVTGPTIATNTINAIYGLVDTAPWLTKDPLDILQASTTECCSNVLFLPGIEASRLYSTNKLWEPIDNADVVNLFLTNTGQSVNPSVHANGIIDSAYGFDIYNNLIAMMNGVTAEKTINAWEPFAYDWRLGVDSFVNSVVNATTSAASSSRLLSDFLSLASSSKTGKVTIVAHSNGGLVAKMLAKTLAMNGKAGLIDKMVMVAVPELGTPQAVAGLLHGDNEDILDGLILGKDTARELGDNAPGAYGLLPSKDYFSVSGQLEPIISFATSTLTDFHFAGDGQMAGNGQRTISTYDSLRTFLTGIADHRSQPTTNGAPLDTSLPSILHTGMIDTAQNIHDILDTFSLNSLASSSKIISLIGVGNDTLASLHYSEQVNCPLTNTFVGIYRPQPCMDSLVHTASTTIFGDGTVVAVSAQGILSGKGALNENYYFNLLADNKGKMIPDSHVNILNSDSGVAFVKEQVTEPTQTSTTVSTLPPYITDTEPTLADFHEDNLVITMHSPVDVNIYDSQGRHTGPIANPDPNSDLGRYEENIPDSRYDPEAADGTTVTVPYGTDYKVILNGTGSGSFTLDTERDQNAVPVAGSQTEFVDMPATPLLKAELILATTTYMSATSTATTNQLLVMDFDGDGIIDATSTSTSTPGGTMDPTAYLRSMERTVKSFGLTAYRQKVMCDKIEKIISYILAKKQIKLDKNAATTANQALSDIHNQHWIFKNLDQVKKDRLTNMFQSILDSVEI